MISWSGSGAEQGFSVRQYRGTGTGSHTGPGTMTAWDVSACPLPTVTFSPAAGSTCQAIPFGMRGKPGGTRAST